MYIYKIETKMDIYVVNLSLFCMKKHLYATRKRRCFLMASKGQKQVKYTDEFVNDIVN